MKIMIRGAGDIASGIAWRLYQAGFRTILMTDSPVPTTVRRAVSFSPCVYLNAMTVEGVDARLARDCSEAEALFAEEKIAVMIDEQADNRQWFQPDVLIDAILAKRNLGTKIDDAGLVIACGPGFCAKEDCHYVVETKRGHYLGRVISDGSAIPDTGVPGNIAGFTSERIIRAGQDGTFRALRRIGDLVTKGEALAEVISPEGETVVTYANIPGVVRGMLQDDVPVHKGMKSGDVDPRGNIEYVTRISEKALAIGGGVLEAVCAYSLGVQR